MRAIALEVGSLVFEGVDEESNDYRLEGRSAWITVDGLTVYIHRTAAGVIVDIYPRSNEADDPALASCEAAFVEAPYPLDYEISGKEVTD
jgi:hypothetical protein